MPGVVFETQAPVERGVWNRMDIACFAGFVERRAEAAVPAALARWLVERGYRKREVAPGDPLLDVPVPVDAWETFDLLFAWERRPVYGDVSGTTYLGAAVRSFFAQGGRKCYVIRAGAPRRYDATRDSESDIAKLIPGFPGLFSVSGERREQWSGIGHLFGLPDVSMLLLPDLPDLVSGPPLRTPEAPHGPDISPERFVEFRTEDPDRKGLLRIGPPAPREAGLKLWARAVAEIARVLASRFREAQFVAALPFGAEPGKSAFVQLAYPWLRTTTSNYLPGALEPPDGVLAGVVARTPLTRGCFRTAAGSSVPGVIDVEPAPRGAFDRVSLLGPTPDGLRLLTDVTASADPAYAPGSVSRLVALIARAARTLGEASVFEPSGQRLWARLRRRTAGLMEALAEEGAVGDFQVLCDRSTMTQNDIDSGRVVARVVFQPVAPVDEIGVVLAMEDGGRVSVSGEAA